MLRYNTTSITKVMAAFEMFDGLDVSHVFPSIAHLQVEVLVVILLDRQHR